MNKVCFVTGASRGIGKEVALVLAKEGYDIALNYRKETDCYSAYIDIDKFIKYINSTGKKSISFKNALLYGGIPLSGELKRTRYQYDVNKLINDIIAKEAL